LPHATWRVGDAAEQPIVLTAGEGNPNRANVRFLVDSAALPVAYKGILPDLFREGQGVVAEGALDSSGVFRADTVLAKHDETYMPKDVADALKKQGHWKDSYGAKAAGSAETSRAAQNASQADRTAPRPDRGTMQ